MTTLFPGAFNVSLDEENGEIQALVRNGWDEQIPDDQTELLTYVDSTLTVLKRLYDTSSQEYASHLRGLYFAAKLGLDNYEGMAFPSIAKKGVDSVRDTIISVEVPALKDRAKWNLFLLAGLLSVAFLAIKSAVDSHFPEIAPWIRGLPVPVVGAAWGVWLSFATGKTELTFESLAKQSENLFSTDIRLLVGLVSATALSVLLHLKLVNSTIGSTDLSKVLSEPTLGLFVGFAAGLTERAVPARVKQAAEKVVKA